MNTNSIAATNTVYDIPTTQHLLKKQPHHTPRAQHANNPVARPDGAPRGRSARSIPPYTTYTAQPSPEETNPALEPAACSIPQAPNPADATGVQACDAQPSPEAARSMRPDVVLMDLNLSGDDLDGIDAAKEIRLATDAKVLLLTSYEKPDVVIQAAKRAFASGYIFKSQCKTLADDVYKTATSRTPQELFIRELLLGGLSPAERNVLDGLLSGDVEGYTASSHKTVTNQKTSIFKKLGVKTTAELLRVFR